MTERPAKIGRKQDGRFAKGVSGNPRGRAQGSRHRATILAERLMQDDARDIVKAVISKAKEGDMAAARIVLDRIAPIRKGSPVRFNLPKVGTAQEIADAVAALLRGVAAGELTPDEASTIAGVVEARRRAIETVELEERLTKLEASAASK